MTTEFEGRVLVKLQVRVHAHVATIITGPDHATREIEAAAVLRALKALAPSVAAAIRAADTEALLPCDGEERTDHLENVLDALWGGA